MWDHLRAGLVILHAIAISIHALPAPTTLSKAVLQEPNMQATFQSWADQATALGWELDRAGVEDIAVEWGGVLLAGRTWVVRPFAPYYNLTGTRQSWQMFGYINRHPGRFEVELEDDGTWRPLYCATSSSAQWRYSQLSQERLRAIVSPYAWKNGRKSYQRMGLWLSKQAARDFPAATKLRIQMIQLDIPSPAELRELGELPEGKTYWQKTYQLSKFR